ncbi:RNA polymerase sigma factor [Paenibacillus favisporus]|uniref:RNA polymerase sigma factor n=1 Tax=Paenibacillus favisporus TaxID=221028 RepID=UPI002DB936A9|nr:RNA polymerase sigma factor [Paenibacillus favisporus]MEC0177513.1 RNA polymerase sigma factor [Paenibacillus favisporus]
MNRLEDLQQIYDQYFQEIYRFVLSLCQDEHIAEEITQETFFKALKRIDTFQGTCKISVWLCQIAKNTYFSYWEGQKRYPRAEPETEPVSQLNVEHKVILDSEALRIHRILHELGEPYKEVFTLRVFGELPFADICSIFGKTESWARVTFHRAKQKIQYRYQEEEQ